MGLSMKEAQRIRRHKRVRRKVYGTEARPRLCVHRSGKNLECQITDDLNQKTLLTFSTIHKKFKAKSPKGSTVGAAKLFGNWVAEELKTKGILKIAFDRAGYLYHGRVKAFADALREGGVNF